MRGIASLRGAPGLLEAESVLAEALGDEERPRAEEMQDARKLAEVAQSELNKGFPLLHSQAMVSLWGSLEDLMRTFLSAWLANEPSAKQVETIRKLKIAVGEYESLDDYERCFHMVDLLERDVHSPLRQGVSRFESILQPFGLSGKVDSEVQKRVYELFQVRNALVHRRGVADRRLTEACPWLNLTPGKPISVSHEMYAGYAEAVAQYATQVVGRVRRRLRRLRQADGAG